MNGPTAHRLVYDPRTERLGVTAAASGFDGTINRTGYELLQRLASGEKYAVLSSRERQFIAACERKGWGSGDGGSFRFAEWHTLSIVPEGPHLKRLQVELTRHCNLECSYCYSGSGPRQKGGLSVNQVRDVLEEAASLGVVFLDLTGGEPLIYPGIFEVLEHARRLGLVVTLHTNGVLLNAERVATLGRLQLRTLQVSLDSHRAEVHDRVRAQRGSFERIVAGIVLARDAGLPVRVNLMVHRENAAHLHEAVVWVRTVLGVPVGLDRVVRTGRELEATIGLSAAEYFELVAPLRSRTVVERRICDSPERSAAEVAPHCGVADSLVYLTAEGEFALCPTMTSREHGSFAGAPLAMGLRHAWLEGAYFARWRGTNCKNATVCPSGAACGGGCRSNAYVETLDPQAPDAVACNIHKNPSAHFKPVHQISRPRRLLQIVP